jgi:hypothetical protein
VPRVVQSSITGAGTITNQVELENVGLILGVTPRISPDGMVVMEIDAEKSELRPEIEGIPISIAPSGDVIRAPIVGTTQAQATVSAADGETIVLGGLITKANQKVERKVPYLADVPILGRLFRYDAAIAGKTELLIILTPYVIRNAADGERIKQLETARMSWCCADVHAIHGVAGLCDITACPMCAAQVPAYYPDFDPRGLQPNNSSLYEPGAFGVEELPFGTDLPSRTPVPLRDDHALPPIPPGPPPGEPTPAMPNGLREFPPSPPTPGNP